jgi:hypothetical protein
VLIKLNHKEIVKRNVWEKSFQEGCSTSMGKLSDYGMKSRIVAGNPGSTISGKTPYLPSAALLGPPA